MMYFPEKNQRPFVCVLKTGGRYRAEHVIELAHNIRRFNSGARIICMTDSNEPMPDLERVPLMFNLPGWFSKLEVFRLTIPVLYLDLDVVLTREVVFPTLNGLYLLRDFGVGSVNSSVMFIEGNHYGILEKFLSNRDRYASEYTSADKWGDQDFIRDYGDISGFIQDISPALAASWKRDLDYRLGTIMSPPAILVFHGHPKPEELNITYLDDGSIKITSARYLLISLLKSLQRRLR